MKDNYNDDDTNINNETFTKILCAVLLLIAVLALLIGTSGCTSERWAVRNIGKVVAYQPAVFAREAANRIPARIIDSTRVEYREGKAVYHVDTVTVDCDSFLIASKSRELNPTVSKMERVRIPCPPSYIRTDTFYVNHYRVTVDQVALNAAVLERDKAIANEKEAKDGMHKWRSWALWTWILIAATVAVILLIKKVF